MKLKLNPFMLLIILLGLTYLGLSAVREFIADWKERRAWRKATKKAWEVFVKNQSSNPESL